MAYKYLQDYQKSDGSPAQRYSNEEDADYIILPIKEYNGLKKAVRIVNDRALQQIDKSKADKFGFRLLRADLKQYKRNSGKLWLVTKETPYSAKLTLGEASYLIEDRLREIYHWTDEQDLQEWSNETINYYRRRLGDSWDVAKIREQWHDKTYRNQYDFLMENSEEGRALKALWSERQSMIVGISKISINYAQGLYEVSYWATEPI